MKATTREWIEKAEADYVSAGREYRARNRPNFDAACFFAQQCIEKYLKGRLAEAGCAIPKTHDLSVLLDSVVSFERVVGSGSFPNGDADELCRPVSLPRRVCDPGACEDRPRRRALSPEHDAVGYATSRSLKNPRKICNSTMRACHDQCGIEVDDQAAAVSPVYDPDG